MLIRQQLQLLLVWWKKWWILGRVAALNIAFKHQRAKIRKTNENSFNARIMSQRYPKFYVPKNYATNEAPGFIFRFQNSRCKRMMWNISRQNYSPKDLHKLQLEGVLLALQSIKRKCLRKRSIPNLQEGSEGSSGDHLAAFLRILCLSNEFVGKFVKR